MSQVLDKFMQGMAAAVLLLNRAIDWQSALESIVLQANLIDGSLRIALILKAQLDSRSDAVDDSLLQQGDSDPKVPKKAIYKRCLEAGIIDKPLFAELSVAYNKRNKCIHRYLLSDIDYDYATELVFELAGIRDRVNAIMEQLENQQIELGVGMTRTGPEMSKEFLKAYATKKEKRYNL
jgi:uncharacterized protein YutE (UPF0331/DUF86 family)